MAAWSPSGSAAGIGASERASWPVSPQLRADSDGRHRHSRTAGTDAGSAPASSQPAGGFDGGAAVVGGEPFGRRTSRCRAQDPQRRLAAPGADDGRRPVVRVVSDFGRLSFIMWAGRGAAGRRGVCGTTGSRSRPSWCVITGRTIDGERSPRASGSVSATSVGQLSASASASAESSAALPARWWSTAGAAGVALGARWSGCSTSRCRRSDCFDTGRR